MSAPGISEATLREVVEALAGMERRAGSAGEREAATWIADRLAHAGARASVEDVEFLEGYALEMLPLALAGVLAGTLTLAGRSRMLATGLAVAATAAIVDDVSNGTRLWRRMLRRRATTQNVVAQMGRDGAPRTLVVLAHHDAAPTGRVFDQSFQRWLARRFPDLVARTDTSLPLWWIVVAGPVLLAAGGLTARRGPTVAGLALSAGAFALGADIARSPVVPGANDNLSAVAAQVALAERLREAPVDGLRVVLASCGAEEVLQGGIYAFTERHLAPLDRARTWVLNLDTVGSPELIMLEGEGPFRMEDYRDPGFRDLIAEVALALGAPLRRGTRSRNSTDSVVTSRAGYPTATIASWEPDTKLLSNYHLMTDTPDRLRYDSVARAAAIAEALARRLAA